jgi:RNA polymerase sigma-70 factor, ECF subfamily
VSRAGETPDVLRAAGAHGQHALGSANVADQSDARPEGAGPVDGDTAAPDDVALLRAHQEGDPQAFADLVVRHRDRLWAVALRTMGNPDDAADALQDALLSAHRNAAQFRGDAAVTTWLHRIVVNACLDRLRRRQARPTVPLPETEAATPADPRDQLSQRETAWEIERALLTLPDEQRAAVVLVDVEGYSVEEAAALLQCPAGTVKSRCSRGRAKLVPLLQHLRNPDHDAGVQPGSTASAARPSTPPAEPPDDPARRQSP